MNITLVIASINELDNLKYFESTMMRSQNDLKILIIDEGDLKLREKNKKILSSFNHRFYGPKERSEWFKKRFGSHSEKYLSVIPERCHAETSFGFLVAYEEESDVIIELDDDVFPEEGHNIIEDHVINLFRESGITVRSKYRWYNTLENLKLNVDEVIFPRGHPYSQETRKQNNILNNTGGKCVLNMGLWAGHPDLDAMTTLYHGGMNGLCDIRSLDYEKDKIIVNSGTYLAICSMNTAFLSEIVPAFYQLYMNFCNIDRFDDIWSGIFLKKIADHLGKKVCIGKPLVRHNKRQRDTFKDLKKELDGMIINEILWSIVDEIGLDGKTYWDSYDSLIQGLEKKITNISNDMYRRFLSKQIENMQLWLQIIDKI